ncbi:DNA-binding protein [Noviherbaspirillum galbum]|uniref:Integrase n=1 Tax=Noviherbaspirillum galbum TaxID=2709383 RepID=A0A6B3SH47_9BURK|nr:DNA-binding protein [Noviherbaspirillum galbum]NEX60197.1 integrase [Noviherbaspirillum galbum]
MARTGIYKTDVRKARDTLLAQRINPSVDAVRVALGNTGSKTTIHRYLKELEEEDGGGKDIKSSISEALQDLVERLAARLHEEASLQIDAVRAEQQASERRHADALMAAKQEFIELQNRFQQLEELLSAEKATHAATSEALQQETIARHTAEQHATDLKVRLTENEAHRQSLEEKHRHSREALEHYRQSVKDQREQDQRRHEQQVQQLQAELRQAQQTVVVRQEEVTRLNQEGARLVSDLSHAQKSLYDAQGQIRRLEQKIDSLQAFEQRAAQLSAQLEQRDQQVLQLREKQNQAVTNAEQLAAQVHGLQLELATVQAKLAAQQEMTDTLRTYLQKAIPSNLNAPAEPDTLSNR